MIRQRNRRGEGSKLRAEILGAAAEILEETGSEDAVTLRAVARRIGIAAPSIYEHFPNREAIVEGVVDAAFVELRDALQRALDRGSDPLDRMRGGCRAYLAFAADRPNRYRVAFERHQLISTPPGGRGFERQQAFELLVSMLRECVEAGASSSQDVEGDALMIWMALHGYAALHPTLPEFPWPEPDAVVGRILRDLAHAGAATSHLSP